MTANKVSPCGQPKVGASPKIEEYAVWYQMHSKNKNTYHKNRQHVIPEEAKMSN